MLQRQLRAIFEELPPKAAKTGMLYSGPLILVVARFFQRHRVPLIVDPVMISTSGARLLKAAAVDVVAEAALARGAEVVLAANDVVSDELDERIVTLAKQAVRA